MRRRVFVVAAVFAALTATGLPASAAPSAGGSHGLALEMLSGPARYVSGGAARVRVVVPPSVPLDRARVAVNGADVTAAFAPDDQAPHALEGVLRDLPAGESTVRAAARHDRATLRLVNHPVTGPMFAGPQQPDFFCSTPQHLAGFDLTGPFLDDDCSLATRTGGQHVEGL